MNKTTISLLTILILLFFSGWALYDFVKKNDLSDIRKEAILTINYDCGESCVLNDTVNFYFMEQNERNKLADYLRKNNYTIEEGNYSLYVGIPFREARKIFNFKKN